MTITISAAARRFLEHGNAIRALSDLTLHAYRADLNDFAMHVGGDTGVAAVNRDCIRNYAQAQLDKGLKATTLRRRIATLKLLFNWLEREEVLPLSVFHRLDLTIRIPRRLPRALDSQEIRALLRKAEDEVKHAPLNSYDIVLTHFAVVALFTTGLRISELTTACVNDVSLLDSSIRVRGKGNRERRVYLPGKQAANILRQFLKHRARFTGNSTNLLVTADGQPVTAQRLRRRLRTLAARAGLQRRVTPHMLRHTAATQLLEAGVDIRFVQRLLGHASIATTQIYAEVRDAALRTRLLRANTLSRVTRACR